MRATGLALLAGISLVPGSALPQTAESGASAAPSYYSVLLGTHFDSSQAEAQRGQVEAQGYAPVFVVGDPPAFRVQFGRFDTLMEARVYRQALDEADVAAHPAVVPLAAATDVEAAENHGAVPSYFHWDDGVLSESDQIWGAETTGATLPPAAGAGPVHVLLAIGSTDQGLLALASLRAAGSQASSEEYSEALSQVLAVARADVGSGNGARLRACWNAAQLLRAKGEHEEAYRAFRDLLGVVRSDDDRAICASELSRVHLRITRGILPFIVPGTAGAGIGTMEEVRRQARRSLAQISGDSPVQRRAAAQLRLTIMESHFYDGSWEASLAAAEDIAALCGDDPGLRAELAAALIRQGMCLMILERNAEAKGALLAAMALDIPPDAWLDDLQPDRSAAVCYATACERDNDPAGFREAVTRLESRYPDHPNTRFLEARLQEIESGGPVQ